MPEPDPLRRDLRRAALTGVALVVLMLCSLGSAYLPLHGLNAAVGLGIAVVKAALVGWIFMRLSSAHQVLRLVAALALGAAGLLAGLAGVDYATRSMVATDYQVPEQAPALHGTSSAIQRPR